MAQSNFLRMWTPAYTCLFLFELLLQMGMQISIPIASNYALALGAGVAVAGFMASLNSICALVVRIVAGPFFSRFNIKSMLIVFTAVFCVSSILCGVVQDIVVLAICRLLVGIGLVGKSTLVIAFAALILPEENRGQGVAWLGICNVFAVAMGPIIGQFIGTNFGWNMAYLVSGGFFLLAGVISFLLKNPSASAAEDKNKPASDAAATPQKRSLIKSLVYIGAVPMAFIALLEATCYGTMSTLTLTVGQLRGIDEISLYFMAYVIVSFIARPFSGKLYDTFGFKKVGVPMASLMVISMIILAYADNLPAILASGALFALGQGCIWPCMQAESVKGVAPEFYSLSANTMLLGVDVGCSLGPILGGFLLATVGSCVMYWVNALAALGLLIMVVFYDKMSAFFRRIAEPKK